MAVTLQQILQTSFLLYTQGQSVPRRVWRAARALMACRTAALGGHVRHCPAGHVTEVWYNSCRQRACPRCCWQRIRQWLDHWLAQLLPTDHFHVIFTLPSELHELWRWNRAVMTEVLFRSVRETLLTLLSDPKWLGATPGILATRHTWSRTFALHAHGHCLVSGGGLTVHGSWQPIRTGVLLPVAVMRSLFRGKVLGALEEVWLTGRLQAPPHWAEDGVRQVLVAAARSNWNIRIAERYPHGRGVVKYLARYVRGGPIKEHRFVKFDGQQVTFRYGNQRERDARGQPQQAELTVAVEEFLRRWSEHVPLPGVHTVRSVGALCEYAAQEAGRSAGSNCRRRRRHGSRRELVRKSLPRDRDRPWEQCPVCQTTMVRVQVLPRAGAPPRVEAWAVAA